MALNFRAHSSRAFGERLTHSGRIHMSVVRGASASEYAIGCQKRMKSLDFIDVDYFRS
jgi:hypothetical protein